MPWQPLALYWTKKNGDTTDYVTQYNNPAVWQDSGCWGGGCDSGAQMWAGHYTMTTAVPSGYTVTYYVDHAEYGSGAGSGPVAGFYCGDWVDVIWYFTPICNANAWQACSTSCGWGVQYNACGTARSCQVNDPNVWGGWGVCSVSCGGGVQYRVNQCGTSQSRACNTQPCTWWQVKDADVSTNGSLTSSVPASNYFGLAGGGGYPGVPVYSGSTNLTPANVSVKGWLAIAQSVGSKVYNYSYFAGLIPADITAKINTINPLNVPGSLNSGTASHDANNYYWYKYDGAANSGLALTIPAVDIGTRKVILLVDNANVNITGNINLTKGAGFFLLIVKGNINVAAGVGGSGPNLEGLYLADGAFSDGVGATQLWMRGSVATYGNAHR